MSEGQAGALGGLQEGLQEEGKEGKGLRPAPQACTTPAGLLVYFGYGIWHSKENQQELQWPATTRYVVFPDGSLEETVQAVQPPSQALVQEPSRTEQLTSP